jgi:hypothetical protein
MKWTHAVIATVVGLLCLAAGVDRAPEVRAAASASRPTPVAATALGRLPLAFEENRGQTDERVRFLVRDRGMTAFLCPTETVFALRSGDANAPRTEVVRMRFVHADATPVVESRDPLPGRANYFIGNDPSRWVTGVPTSRRVVEHDVWPGVDVVWRSGENGRLTYDLVVAPGADLGAASFELDGVRRLRVDADGALEAATALGELRHSRPVAYQVFDGARRSVEAAFAVDGRRVGFAIGDYDRTRPLVVDPSVAYATYLGGSAGESARAIAVDATGAAYVAGGADSADFPTQSAFQAANAGGVGGVNAVIAKISADGAAIVYATYLGGSSSGSAYGIVVDGSGAAFVTGSTTSTNFPTLNAFQSSNGASGSPSGSSLSDAFVTKLAPSGSALVYSTYLGGTGDESGKSIALDATGAAYVVGSTDSFNFPTQAPFQGPPPGVCCSIGYADAFITKINPSGGSLAYSTYLGGHGTVDNDVAYAVAVDSAGAAYVAGSTNSAAGFPTQSPLQGVFAGGANDAFVAKVNSSGSALVWSTFLGGSGDDSVKGIAVDSSGAVLVAGRTTSTDFPTTAGSFQPSYAGGAADAFVAKIGSSGAALAWSTFLGGGGDDACSGIGLDASGTAAVTGTTRSSDFPTASPTQSSMGGGFSDAFVGRLDPSGASLVFGTYLGGSSSEQGLSIAVGPTGDAYAAGQTSSGNLPLQSPLQATYAGGADCYVARYSIGSGGPVTPPPSAPSNLVATYAEGAGVSLAWTDNATDETGFRVERKPASYSYALLATTGANVTSAIDVALFPSTTYTYRVRAVNAGGSSSWSNEASVTTSGGVPVPAVPRAPTQLAVFPGETFDQRPAIDLAWIDNSSDEVLFDVERAVGGSTFKHAAHPSSDATGHSDEPVHPGWPYSYRVRALSLQGPSPWSNIATAATPATLELSTLSGRLTDSTKSRRDKLVLSAAYTASPGAAATVLDPVADGLELHLGAANAPLVVSISPGDAAWKVKTKKGIASKATWKSAKGVAPKMTIVVDLVRHVLTATVSGADFTATPSPLVRVLLACGADGGAHATTWTESKPGVFKFTAK